MRFQALFAAKGNPDRGQYADPAPKVIAQGNSIEEIREQFRAYCNAYDLGGGNIPRVTITDMHGMPLCYMSYNGRLWCLDAETTPYNELLLQP